MKNLMLAALLTLVINTGYAAVITCFVNTPNQIQYQGSVAEVGDNLYRIQGPYDDLHYVPANQCVVDGVVWDKRDN